jgi:hypothetical protein
MGVVPRTETGREEFFFSEKKVTAQVWRSHPRKGKRQRKRFFFEKKNQKTLTNSG